MTFYALDIETIELPLSEKEREALKTELEKKEQDIIAKCNAQYKKQETIEKHITEELVKAKKDQEKSLEGRKFQRGCLQIVCVGFGKFDFDGIKVTGVYHPDEKTLIEDVKKMLDERYDGGSPIYTYNGFSFDLPHLLYKFGAYNVKLKAPIYKRNFQDLMRDPFEYYQKNISLDALCDLYGIKLVHNTIPDMEDCEPINGEHVARMFELDCVDGGKRVLQYCKRDITKTLMLADKIFNFISF